MLKNPNPFTQNNENNSIFWFIFQDLFNLFDSTYALFTMLDNAEHSSTQWCCKWKINQAQWVFVDYV